MTHLVTCQKSAPILYVIPRTKNHPRVFQTPRNDGHVLECGGVPPLLGKTRVSFCPRLPRRSKSGGAPPHSKTQAKLGAANDAPGNLLKISTNSLRQPRTKNHARVFQTLQINAHAFVCAGVAPLLQ